MGSMLYLKDVLPGVVPAHREAREGRVFLPEEGPKQPWGTKRAGGGDAIKRQ